MNVNEPEFAAAPNRSTQAAAFHTRLVRFRRLMAKRWWFLVLATALGAGGAYALVRYIPPIYESKGQMIVSVKLNIPEGSAYIEELMHFLGTQAALMQSGTVQNRALNRLAAQSPELAARRPVPRLQATVQNKTSIFILTATSPSPDFPQPFLQACMDEYFAMKKEMFSQATETTLLGLTKELRDLEKELTACETELVSFSASNSLELLQEQGGHGAGVFLADLNQRLLSARIDQELAQSLSLENRTDAPKAASNPPAGGAAAGGGAATAIRPLLTAADLAAFSLPELKAQELELSQVLRPEHPRMVVLTDEIAHREHAMQDRKAALTTQVEVIQKALNEWVTRVQDISRKEAEYEKLKGKSQRTQALYDRLLATMQTLDVNKQINPESVAVMENASPALEGERNSSQRLALGALAGLVIGLGILLLVDRLDDRLSSVNELAQLFDEPVLAQIPMERSWSKGDKVPLLAPSNTAHGAMEAFRSIRSSLHYMSETGRAPRVILVTGSLPGEGKSFTALNLASTLAATGSRVLLVDGDLRKGILHKCFDLPSKPGLSEVLSEGRPWAELVKPTTVSNLWLLPLGTPTQKSGDLFMGPTMQQFLKDAPTHYDYVVVDTAPVMAADDVTALAPHADGIVFVIRAERTSARVAHAALDELIQRRGLILGLVFNAVRKSAGSYYYYYRDYYHAHPGKEKKAAS